MSEALDLTKLAKGSLNATSPHFLSNKYAYYAWLREHAPIIKANVSVMKLNALSRYDDCAALMRDDRFVRDRGTASGKSSLPFPVPKSVRPLMENMILKDDPQHKRLRALVQPAFVPRTLRQLEANITSMAHALLDGNKLETGQWTDLLEPARAALIPPLEEIFAEDARSNRGRG